MSSINDHSDNPYRPPVASVPGRSFETITDSETLTVLIKFRQQIHALGGLWIILGGLAIIAGFLISGSNTAYAQFDGAGGVILAICVVMGSLWIGLGAMACIKQMWAVYVGLVLCYLSVVGNLLNLNVCGVAILIVAIVQAHRVIGWSNQLKRRGVSLHHKS